MFDGVRGMPMKDNEVTLMSFGLTQLLHLLVALEIMSSS